MLTEMPLFQIYSAMARHAAESQRISATNLAHINEPGYKAQEIEPFSAFMARSAQGPETILTERFRVFEPDLPGTPNGNTVNLEQETFRSAEAVSQHTLALTVYSKSIDLMRTALGKRI